MKRILALVLLLAMILCGCGTEESPYVPTGDALDESTVSTLPEEEQALSLPYYPERSLNPFLCTDATNRVLFPLIYQGLFSIDRNYNVTPLLCGNYRKSRDMRTYTFYLAENATFSDGSLVTGADVTASLQAAMAEGFYAGRFHHVISVETLEDGGIQIVLDTPYENLPLLLDIPIVPAEQVAEEQPLGTGPYQIDQRIGGLQLRRQAFWWCSSQDLLIRATNIPLITVSSTVDTRDAFELEKVSLVYTDPGLPTFAEFRCDYELWDGENGIFLYLVADIESEVFSNPKVRKALTHAIDRQLLVDSYLRGFAQAATLPASPSSQVYNQTQASQYGFNKDLFIAALNEAGMVGKEITILLNCDDATRLRIGRHVVQMLQDCGLVVNVMELNSKEFMVHVIWGVYDLYLGQTKLSPNMDLSEFFATDGAMNYGSLADPALYAMSLEALANSGNFYNLHKLVMEDGRLCPLLFRSSAVYVERGLFSEMSPAKDNLFPYTIGKTMADVLISQ